MPYNLSSSLFQVILLGMIFFFFFLCAFSFNILFCLNGSSIKLWTLTGQILMEMMGHTSLVYSVAAHSSGLVASGSEDCFLKIWRGGLFLS